MIENYVTRVDESERLLAEIELTGINAAILFARHGKVDPR